jgi:hypothetical protein
MYDEIPGERKLILALFELFGWLKYFREQRRRENLSQRELLKKELRMLAYAILGVFVVTGFLIGLALIFTR